MSKYKKRFKSPGATLMVEWYNVIVFYEIYRMLCFKKRRLIKMLVFQFIFLHIYQTKPVLESKENNKETKY